MSNHKVLQYYYQIIPLVRLPLTRANDFTYHTEEQIEFGSIVKIKLNNKMVKGVLLEEFRKTSSVKKPTFKTSPILEIISPAQITKSQLALAKLISKYYLTPLSTTLKFFAFSLTKKNNATYFENLTKQVIEIKETKWQNDIILTTEQKKAIQQIIETKKSTSTEKNASLLFGPPASGKTEVIIETIKSILGSGRQSLILIPEIFLSYQEIVRYSSKFIEGDANEVAILHSQLKPSEITTIWNGVKSGEIKIVISTRMGIFLPFKNLGLVVVDEEQDISHKQWDTTPFYHTRQVASLLQEVYSRKTFPTKILLVSSTPSLNSYQQITQKSGWQLIKLPSLKTELVTVKNPIIELVDLKKYYKKGQQIFVSNELRFALKNVLDRNKVAMLLVPRRGKSNTIICQDCQEVPTCPDCQVPLVHSENNYRCLHCNFKISNISKCPHCGSFRLADVGFGTESVKDTIQTMFPSARTAIADSLTFKDNAYRQKILSDLYNNKLDFLIGTYTIAKGLDIKDVELVTILNADNWPGQTDFRFDENYLSTIFQLAGRVNRPGGAQNGKCLIQTFDPTNRIFTYLKNWDWEEFTNYELENREGLGYPPFKHLLKITYRNYNREIVEKELDKLHKKLEIYQSTKKKKSRDLCKVQGKNEQRSKAHECASSSSGVFDEEICQISGLLSPYFGHQEKLRGEWRKHLLLKIPTMPITDKKLLKILDLSTGWKIDVDTENVF
jgi:primosomal protein N'